MTTKKNADGSDSLDELVLQNIEELIARCEKIHTYTGWYCMSCDSEVDATFSEHCDTCGTPLDGNTLTGKLIEAAKLELEQIKQNV